MLRIYPLKGLFIGFLLSGAGVLHVQATTPKPFWHCHAIHLDAGAMTYLKLSKELSNEKKGEYTGRTRIDLDWLPVVALGYKWTDTLGKDICYQIGLDYSFTQLVLRFLIPSSPLFGLWFAIDGRLGVGYLNSKDMLFTLGVGTKYQQLFGGIAADVPLSKHFYLTAEASCLLGDILDQRPIFFITTTLSYKF